MLHTYFNELYTYWLQSNSTKQELITWFFFFSFFLSFSFYLRHGLSLSPGWNAVARSWLTATSAPWVQAILLPQPASSWDNRPTVLCPANFCIFFVEMGFCHIAQAGLKLVSSSSACLDLLKCWAYRHKPPFPARYLFLPQIYPYI